MYRSRKTSADHDLSDFSMPNGDCPLGAENRANIAANSRRITDMSAKLDRIEVAVQKLVTSDAVQAWKIGAIIGGIIGAMTTIGVPIILHYMFTGGG